MTIIVKNKDTVVFDNFEFKCSIGAKGSNKNKYEGDKKLQEVVTKLEIFIFEKTGIINQKKLKCIPIKKNMGWCDDPKNKKYYNKLIRMKKISNVKLFIVKTTNMIFSSQ